MINTILLKSSGETFIVGALGGGLLTLVYTIIVMITGKKENKKITKEVNEYHSKIASFGIIGLDLKIADLYRYLEMKIPNLKRVITDKSGIFATTDGSFFIMIL